MVGGIKSIVTPPIAELKVGSSCKGKCFLYSYYIIVI